MRYSILGKFLKKKGDLGRRGEELKKSIFTVTSFVTPYKLFSYFYLNAILHLKKWTFIGVSIIWCDTVPYLIAQFENDL